MRSQSHPPLCSRLAAPLVFSRLSGPPLSRLASTTEEFRAGEPGQRAGHTWPSSRLSSEQKNKENGQLDISSQGPVNRVSVFVGV